MVVDTSVLIDLAGGDLNMASVLDRQEVFISIITGIEFLAWPKLTETGVPVAMALLEQYARRTSGGPYGIRPLGSNEHSSSSCPMR